MRISDWSSDMCSSDLERLVDDRKHLLGDRLGGRQKARAESADGQDRLANGSCHETVSTSRGSGLLRGIAGCLATGKPGRQVTPSGGPRSGGRCVGKEWVSKGRYRW